MTNVSSFFIFSFSNGFTVVFIEFLSNKCFSFEFIFYFAIFSNAFWVLVIFSVLYVSWKFKNLFFCFSVSVFVDFVFFSDSSFSIAILYVGNVFSSRYFLYFFFKSLSFFSGPLFLYIILRLVLTLSALCFCLHNFLFIYSFLCMFNFPFCVSSIIYSSSCACVSLIC